MSDLDNVLRLRLAAKERGPAAERNQQRRLSNDWAAALEAVQRASETMAATEHRAREVEAQGVALAERALAELQSAEARIRDAEEALRRAEMRAAEAEARAQEAEEWLARLHEAIQDRLVFRRPDPRHANTAAA